MWLEPAVRQKEGKKKKKQRIARKKGIFLGTSVSMLVFSSHSSQSVHQQ